MTASGEIRRHGSSTPAGGSWTITIGDGRIVVTGGAREAAYAPIDIPLADVPALIADIDAAVKLFEQPADTPAISTATKADEAQRMNPTPLRVGS